MKSSFIRISFLICGLFFFSFAVMAQKEISYELSFPNAVHHEAEITMTIAEVPAGPLKIRMSRSSPGRYATHEFGKNIYRFRAFDEQGKKLNVVQPAGDEYVIPQHGAKVKVTYTLYGNWVDGTYAAFDDTHAHISIPASFAFPVGMDKRPRLVRFKDIGKKNWKVATQLKPLQNGSYYAPDFQYFMDSPIELAAFQTKSWAVKNPDGKTQNIHLIAHSKDNEGGLDAFAEMLKKLVEEQRAVWGEYPDFDYGNYYFLHDVYPTYAGDGMEHRNSTVIVQRTPKIAGYEKNLLGTFSHEFFHSWNVERLRPKSLEPFDFTHSDISGELWIAEGFTQYYGNLILARTGFRTQEQVMQTFTGLVNAALLLPGATHFSPVEASRYAVFADAGVSIDQSNKANIFTSYYTYGASIALALDLTLRAEFNLSLDDYMRALWKAYGKTEIAYTIADLEKTLGSLTKNPAFAAGFFKNQIYGTAKSDYAKLLLRGGWVLRKSDPGKCYSGLERLRFENGKALIGQTLVNEPAYLAGLDAGATLLEIDGSSFKNQEELNKIIAAHKPGDVLQIKYSYYGDEKSTSLTLAEDPGLEIVSIEKTGGQLSNEMRAFREKWLSSQINNK